MVRLETHQKNGQTVVRVYSEPLLDPLVIVTATDDETVEQSAIRGLAQAYIEQGQQYGAFETPVADVPLYIFKPEHPHSCRNCGVVLNYYTAHCHETNGAHHDPVAAVDTSLLPGTAELAPPGLLVAWLMRDTGEFRRVLTGDFA